MRWRSGTDATDAMFGTGHEETSYAVGWAISGAATLAALVAIWMLGI